MICSAKGHCSRSSGLPALVVAAGVLHCQKCVPQISHYHVFYNISVLAGTSFQMCASLMLFLCWITTTYHLYIVLSPLSQPRGLCAAAVIGTKT